MGDVAGLAAYHYYPALEQVRAWLDQAGLAIEEEGTGDGYVHLLARKSAQMMDRLFRDAAGRPAVETRFRVRFFETDQMGVVHHTAYITWFEEGRSAFTRAIGYPYAQMERDGISLAVAEVSARYHQPARYDDEVIVTTALDGFPSRGMNFSYEVRRSQDGALLVTGSTRHVSVNRAGQVQRVLDAIRQRILVGIGGT